MAPAWAWLRTSAAATVWAGAGPCPAFEMLPWLVMSCGAFLRPPVIIQAVLLAQAGYGRGNSAIPYLAARRADWGPLHGRT